MMWARATVLLVMAFALALPAGAQAQEVVAPVDGCVGVDHFPDEPVGDNPSKLVVGAVFDPSFAGDTWVVVFAGASGLITGETTVGPDGVATIDVGISSYGDYTVAESTLGMPGGDNTAVDLSGLADNGTFTVDENEVACDPTALVTATTTASTTTTTEATTTTTAAPVTTGTVAPSTTVATTAPASEGTSWGPTAIVLGLIFTGLGLGMWVFGKGGRSCQPLLEEWQHRLSMLDQTKEGLKAAREHLTDLKARTARWRSELAALQRSRDSSVVEHGTRYHLIDGGRVTAQGLEELITTHAEALASAERDEAEGQKSVEGWEKRLAEAKANEAKAHKAYEECVGEAFPAPVDDPEPGPEAPVGGPTSPGIAAPPPPPEQPPCTEGTRKLQRAGTTKPVRVMRDFSVIVEVESGSERKVSDAKDLAVNLSQLAGELGAVGSLLGGFGAGTGAVGAGRDLVGGSYVKSGAGFVKSGIDGYIAGADPNIGTKTFPISIPTSPQEAGVELLEATARLGGLIAGKVGEWMAKNQLYTIRVTYFEQEIKATPYEVHACKGGTWVCVEKVYEYQVGKLTRRDGQSVSNIAIRDDLAKARFEREVNRLTAAARSALEQSVRKRAEFESEHQPGPCGS